MLSLNGFELYSRWVPLIKAPVVQHLRRDQEEQEIIQCLICDGFSTLTVMPEGNQILNTM